MFDLIVFYLSAGFSVIQYPYFYIISSFTIYTFTTSVAVPERSILISLKEALM